MKVLKTDNTKHIFADCQIVDDTEYDAENYKNHLANMGDDYPSNYTQFHHAHINGCIEARTENSEVIGIAGANVESAVILVCEGTIHDANDVVADGTFQDWTAGVPDHWTVEANANVTEGTEAVEIGGYSYTKFLRMVDPNASVDIAVKQTSSVDSDCYYVLIVAGQQRESPYKSKLSIKDETNGGYIANGVNFDCPGYSGSPTDAKDATYYYVFQTPATCESITLSLWVEDYTDMYFNFRGVSIRPVSERIEKASITPRLYDGELFNSFMADYTKITGAHSVFVSATFEAYPGKIGCLQTGLLEEYLDPDLNLKQGLESTSVVTDLKYGGRLENMKYNKDVFSGPLTLLAANATEFMHSLVPTIRLNPRFWKIGNLDSDDWSVFARFRDIPVVSNNKSVTNTINITLEEVL